MNREERLVCINAAIARANIRCAGMVAENAWFESNGNTIPYGEDAFNQIIEEEGIHHNAIVGFLGGN